MSKPKSRIAKGKILENFIAQRLRDKGLDKKAVRTLGSGSGREKSDTHTNLTILGRQACIECKNQKTIKLMEWVRQTEKQTLGYGEPLLIIKPPRQPLEASLAVLSYETLFDLLVKAQEPKTLTGESREQTWLIKSAIQILKKLLKTLEK